MEIQGFLDEPIPAEAQAELESHFTEADTRFEGARVRRHAMGCDILADVTWHEFGDDGPGHTVRHTVVFLHRPGTTLPEFEIRPRRGVGEKILGALVSALGMPSLELEDEPTFNERYSILTANPESVKVLIGREAIDALLGVEDLFLKFGSRGVLASRHSVDGSSGGRSSRSGRDVRDHRLEGEARRRLVVDALVGNGPIVDDPETGRRAADAVEGTYGEEAARHYAEAGGLIGRQVRKTLITAEMLDRLRDAPPPRADIPAPIARRAWGGTTFPLLIASGFGLAFTTIGILIRAGGATEGLAFIGIGGLALVGCGFILRFRWMRKRLVGHGLAVEGRISAVERTNTSVNDDPIHAITIETVDRGDPVVVKLGSAPAGQARRMMQSTRTTWVLRDPSRPSRGLWIEGWCLERGVD